MRSARHTRRLIAVAAAALPLLVLVSCSSGSPAEGTTSSSAAESSTPSSSAASAAGASSSAPATGSLSSAPTTSGDPAYVATLQPQIEQMMTAMSTTGVGILIRSPELGDWSSSFGTRTWHGTEPVTVDDHVRVGSITKTMTGTVILQLVDEGLIGLDDPVSKYRSDVPDGDNITIRQLLNMSSGLANYTTNPTLNEQMDNNPSRVWDPEELITMGLAEPPAFPPGTDFFYSNTNTALLGEIAAQLTGTPLPELIKTRVLAKASMTQSVYPEPADATIPDPHPQGYSFGTNVGTIDSNVLSPEVQAGALDGTLEPYDTTNVNPSWAGAAGAAISTLDDLAAYGKLLAGGGLISPELQQQRLDSVQPTPSGASYGLALAKFGQLYGHTGELPGYNSFVGYDPERDITVVTWASLAPAPTGVAPAVEIAKTVIATLYPAG